MDDAGLKLLQAFEALHEEVRAFRKEAREDREAREQLASKKFADAERQARFRQRHGTNGVSAAIREMVFDRNGRKCVACGSGDRLSLDHIVPQIMGGDNDESNLQTMCVPCNSRKNSNGFRTTEVTLHSVTGNATSGVVKALDLALKLEDQEKIPAGGLRNVTSRNAKPTATAPAWEAYTAAFVARYGVKPVRNATTNSQMAQVVKRLGAEAAEVAGFYVAHPLAWYAQKQHPVGLLLNDAEALRTQWARGEATTATGARMAERSAENVGSWAKHLKGEA